MTTEITNCPAVTEQWYMSLIEDLQDVIVETEFTSRWAIIEGYHQVGSRILQEYENFQRLRMPDTELIATVATSLNKRPRTVYYAVQFARMYPDLALLPEGKNANWHQVVNKYLTTGEKKPTIVKVDLYRMIKEIKELLNTEYLKAHQEKVEIDARRDYTEMEKYPARMKCEYIRYLQDQVSKITEGLQNGA